MKPDVQMVAELFPKFGAPDYSTEVSRLLALRPDVVFTTSWGGDLDTLGAAGGPARPACSSRRSCSASASLRCSGSASDVPEGLIVGARGDHWFLHPEMKDEPDFKAFNEAFKTKTGAWPIYPGLSHGAGVLGAAGRLRQGRQGHGGKWPTREQVIDAAAGPRPSPASGRPVTLRPEDNQGIEAQLVGAHQEGGRLRLHGARRHDDLRLAKTITMPAAPEDRRLAEDAEAGAASSIERADVQARRLTTRPLPAQAERRRPSASRR